MINDNVMSDIALSFANTDHSSETNEMSFLPSEEGELAVDVFRDGSDLIVRAPVAGAKPNDLDIHIHHDLLTIRGQRSHERTIEEHDWMHRECYWGSFSRTLLLPEDVESERARASYINGVLEIRLPIRTAQRKIPVHTH